MERLTSNEKNAIVACINSFNFSGLDRVNGNSICRYASATSN